MFGKSSHFNEKHLQAKCFSCEQHTNFQEQKMLLVLVVDKVRIHSTITTNWSERWKCWRIFSISSQLAENCKLYPIDLKWKCLTCLTDEVESHRKLTNKTFSSSCAFRQCNKFYIIRKRRALWSSFFHFFVQRNAFISLRSKRFRLNLKSKY